MANLNGLPNPMSSPLGHASFTLDLSAILPSSTVYSPTAPTYAPLTIDRPMASPFPVTYATVPQPSRALSEIETFGSPVATIPAGIRTPTIAFSQGLESAIDTPATARPQEDDTHHKFPAWQIFLITFFGLASIPISIAVVYLLRMSKIRRRDYRHDEEWSSSFWKRHRRGKSGHSQISTYTTRRASPTPSEKLIADTKAQHKADKAARRASRAEIRENRKMRKDRPWGHISPPSSAPGTPAAGSAIKVSKDTKPKLTWSWSSPSVPHPGVKQKLVETEIGRAWGRPRRLEDLEDKVIVVPAPGAEPKQVSPTSLNRASKMSPTLMTPAERKRSLAAGDAPDGEDGTAKGMSYAEAAGGSPRRTEFDTIDFGGGPEGTPDPRSPSAFPRTPRSARFDIDDGTFDRVPLSEAMQGVSPFGARNGLDASTTSPPARAQLTAAEAIVIAALDDAKSAENAMAASEADKEKEKESKERPLSSVIAPGLHRLSRAWARFSISGPSGGTNPDNDASTPSDEFNRRASRRQSRGNRRYSMEEAGDAEAQAEAESVAPIRSRSPSPPPPNWNPTLEEALSGPLPATSPSAKAQGQILDAEAASAILEAEAAEQRMLQTVRRSVDFGGSKSERRSSGIADGLPRSPLRIVAGEDGSSRRSSRTGSRRASRLSPQEGKGAAGRRRMSESLGAGSEGEVVEGLGREKRRSVVPRTEGGYGQ